MDVGLDVDLAIVAASGRTTWNSVSLTAGLKFFLRSARVSIRRVPGRLKAALYDKHTSRSRTTKVRAASRRSMSNE